MTVPETPGALAAEVAAAVLAHPAVAELDGDAFGTVVSHLPGRRRVVGVRIGVRDEPVELSVVAHHPTSLPALAEELGAVVRELLGPVPVTVTVTDVVPAPGRATAMPGLLPEGPAGPVTGMPPTVAGPSAPVRLA